MTIGLTGGIACGKSTVRASISARHKVVFFDADECVHNILETDVTIAGRVKALFGPQFLRRDGKPNRKALRDLVFGTAGARRHLEDLLHPLVRTKWLYAREQCLANGAHFLADIPLLYETGAERFFDAVVVVACSRETQVSRLRDRGIDLLTAQTMLASQLPLGQKVSQAAFVIWNDGSMAALGRQTELVAKQLFHD